MKIKYIIFLLFASIVSSCNHDTSFTEVKTNNNYSISMADYLQPCKDLHKEASLQYQNTEKDIYAIVIDEKKKTMKEYDLNYNLDMYFKNVASQPFVETIKNGKVSAPEQKEINGNKSMIAEITGKLDQTEVFYKMAVVETSTTFYQILIWTRADNKEKFEKDMITMIESFKEIPV